VQWYNGRVLDLISRGHRFDAHLSPLQAGLTGKLLSLPQWLEFDGNLDHYYVRDWVGFGSELTFHITPGRIRYS